MAEANPTTVLLTCSDCGGQQDLDPSQSKLYLLGLYPFRCLFCRKLKAGNPARHPQIVVYMRGTPC